MKRRDSEITNRFIDVFNELKKEQIIKGVSDLANKLNDNQPNISAILTGKRGASQSLLNKLFSTFHTVNKEYIYTGEGDMLKSDGKTQIAQTAAISDEQLLQEIQKLKDELLEVHRKHTIALEENKKLFADNMQLREEIKNYKKIIREMEQRNSNGKPFVKQDEKLSEPLPELQVYNGMILNENAEL